MRCMALVHLDFIRKYVYILYVVVVVLFEERKRIAPPWQCYKSCLWLQLAEQLNVVHWACFAI